MENIQIKEDVIPTIKQLLHLYADVQWTAYTKEPEILKKALKNCLKVWTVWDGDQLVGLARVVGGRIDHQLHTRYPRIGKLSTKRNRK